MVMGSFFDLTKELINIFSEIFLLKRLHLRTYSIVYTMKRGLN